MNTEPDTISISRRRFLRWTATGGLLLAVTPLAYAAIGQSTPAVVNAALGNHDMHAGPAPVRKVFRNDLYAAIPRVPETLTVMPRPAGEEGLPPLVYAAQVEGRTVYNPTLVLRTGQRVQLKMHNALAEPTIVHWHGIDCDWRQAGHPSYQAAPGGTYQYDFTISNRAGTFWYHPHPHGLTAKQAHQGLAGFFIVRDAEEESLARQLGVILGQSDLPLVLHDRRTDTSGDAVYAPTATDKEMGLIGNTILCNGVKGGILDVPRSLVRLRLLNGSNARIFRVGFDMAGKPLPFHLIAVDGGFLPRPHAMQWVFLSPGERAEVVLDLAQVEPGTAITLVNRPFDSMHAEGGHGADASGSHGSPAGASIPAGNAGAHGAAEGAHGASANTPSHGSDQSTSSHGGSAHDASADTSPHGGGAHGSPPASGPAEGDAFSIVQLLVTSPAKGAPGVLPQSLPSRPEPRVKSSTPVRRFTLALTQHGTTRHWTMNGLTFDMKATPVVVEKRMPEIWEIINDAKSMPHPMHLHGYLFAVLGRSNSPAQVTEGGVDAQGRIPTDLGPKDTILVWPGETVRIHVDFGQGYPTEAQTFLFHCHNLEHEDAGMMLNVLVK